MRLIYKDIPDILKLFEDELSYVHDLTKIGKMKFRRRVGDILKPTLQLGDRKPEAIIRLVDDKLSAEISLFLDKREFKNKLLQKLEENVVG